MLSLATILLFSAAVALTNAVGAPGRRDFKDVCPPVDINNAVIDSGAFSPDFSNITCFYVDSAVCTYSFTVRSILSPFFCANLIYLFLELDQ
jgi:hypothetical protein